MRVDTTPSESIALLHTHASLTKAALSILFFSRPRPASSRGASRSSTALWTSRCWPPPAPPPPRCPAAPLLAVCHPSSAGLAALAPLPPPPPPAPPLDELRLAWCASLPGRSIPHISHSHSEPLFKKVQREHSHSDDSDDLVGALVASDLAVRETDVEAATLVVAAAGGLYDCAAAW